MSEITPVFTGNIASTPIKAPQPLMSPTEVAAFSPKAAPVETTSATISFCETVDEERWTEPKLGDSISNTFKRVTRRARIDGGSLYSTCTYLMTYVRGVSDSAISETLIFVPDSEASTEAEEMVRARPRKYLDALEKDVEELVASIEVAQAAVKAGRPKKQ